MDCFSHRICRTFIAFAALSFFGSSEDPLALSCLPVLSVLDDLSCFPDLVFGGMTSADLQTRSLNMYFSGQYEIQKLLRPTSSLLHLNPKINNSPQGVMTDKIHPTQDIPHDEHPNSDSIISVQCSAITNRKPPYSSTKIPSLFYSSLFRPLLRPPDIFRLLTRPRRPLVLAPPLSLPPESARSREEIGRLSTRSINCPSLKNGLYAGSIVAVVVPFEVNNGPFIGGGSGGDRSPLVVARLPAFNLLNNALFPS